jgi:hypothetical protein
VSFPFILRNRILILRNRTLRRFGRFCSACSACSPCSDCSTCSDLLLGFPVILSFYLSALSAWAALASATFSLVAGIGAAVGTVLVGADSVAGSSAGAAAAGALGCSLAASSTGLSSPKLGSWGNGPLVALMPLAGLLLGAAGSSTGAGAGELVGWVVVAGISAVLVSVSLGTSGAEATVEDVGATALAGSGAERTIR